MHHYLTQSLHKSLRGNPDKIATICKGRSQTYNTFVERVARFANALRTMGFKPGAHASILALNSDKYFEMIYGILWAGGVVNPLNTRWQEKELQYALTDAESPVLIVDNHFSKLLPKLKRESENIKHFICDGDSSALSDVKNYEDLIAKSGPMEDTFRSGNDLAMLLYTGGTTGLPKGVMLSHENLSAAALGQAAIGCGTSGRNYLHVTPMFHMSGIQMMLNHFLNGGTHIVVAKFDPAEILQTIEEQKVSDVMMVPTMIHMLINHPDMAKRDASSLKTVFYGAAPMPQQLLHDAMRALPECSFVQGYGMTETGLTTMLPAYYHTKAGQSENKLASAGQPTALAEFKIVNEQGDELPIGEVGEMVIRGPSITKGYWKKPEQTAKALRNGWLHTEDLGYMDADGFFFIVDRLKDMIVSGGENVYSTEVENTLSLHGAIDQCAVIGIPDEKWGEAVHAVVVLKTGSIATAEELILHCRSHIADYKCPRGITITDSLPQSAAGKLLKTKLREQIVNNLITV